MFKLGSARSKSPRRAASAMYGHQGGSAQQHPGSPPHIAVQDPHQRPFSPWGSTDSQSSTSPRNSARGRRSAARNKRPTSPTASIATTATTSAASMMTKSSRSFLGRQRKHSAGPNVNEEFDPTTFRKNRSRPTGPRGQDAVYEAYDDLFDDELDEEDEEGEDEHQREEVHRADGNEEEDGFFMLQIEEQPEGTDGNNKAAKGLQRNPQLALRPKTGEAFQRQSETGPQSREENIHDFLHGPPQHGGQLRVMPSMPRTSSLPSPASTVSASSIHVPPGIPAGAPSVRPITLAAPPTQQKSWQRSIVTTTPPRSTAPSVDESTEQLSTVFDTPPTPPPPRAALSINTNIHNDTLTEILRRENEDDSETIVSSHRRPPTPPNMPGRFNKRVPSKTRISNSTTSSRPGSQPDALGIVSIPSPTLFFDGLSPATASEGDQQQQLSHVSASHNAALTGMAPRQTSFPLEETSTIKRLPVLPRSYEESTGTSSNAAATARPSSLTQEDSYGSEAGTIKVRLGVNTSSLSPPQQTYSASNNSAATDHSVESLLDQMLSEQSEVETEASSAASREESETDTGKEVVQFSIVDFDGKEVVQPEAGLEVGAPPFSGAAPNHGVKIAVQPPAEEAEEGKPDTAHLKAFRGFLKASGDNDAFVSRGPRFDAVQAQRICSNLQDASQPEPPAPKRKGPKPRRSSKARHREVGEEIMNGLWSLMALRWLNFGKVIISPGHSTLLAVSAKQLTRRATVKANDRAANMLAEASSTSSTPLVVSKPPLNWKQTIDPATGSPIPMPVSEEKERRRVLDLGGAPVADWGWHCAMDYPKVKVYTVTQRSSSTPPTPVSPTTPAPGPSRGPRNHRHLSVERLYRLPFPANHFDVVSARSLPLHLQLTANTDEYERCLAECMRVLKPGGFLEFMIMDADIMNAGPLASDLASRFTTALKQSSRDPEPSKKWVSRLNSAGFDEIRRAWMFLPMAAPVLKPQPPSKEMEHTNLANQSVNDHQDINVVKEEMRRRMAAWEDVGEKGSVEHAAGIAGLWASSDYVKWLKHEGLESEDQAVGRVMEEAKAHMSGWRCLVGWARKPLE